MIATPRIPPALARTGSAIRAAGPQSLEAMYGELNEMLRNNFTQTRERAENLEAAMQAMQAQINNVTANGATSILPVEPEYTRAFTSYFRRGDAVDVLRAANATGERATVHAALSVGSNSDGGYLAPVEWDR